MTDYTTVYRATHRNAETDASALKNMLVQNGVNAELVDAGRGAWDVRVAASDVQEALNWIAQVGPQDANPPVNPSHEYDFVPVAATDGAVSEMEAMSIQSILDASGINCVVIGANALPNLGFEVRVPREDLERAKEVILEARAAGPAAAEEASQAQE